MFEVIAGATPGQLKPDTIRAVLDGSIKIIGKELKAMRECLPDLNGVQRCLLKLILCEAVQAIAEHEQRCRFPACDCRERPCRKDSLEPAGGSGMPGNPYGCVDPDACEWHGGGRRR